MPPAGAPSGGGGGAFFATGCPTGCSTALCLADEGIPGSHPLGTGPGGDFIAVGIGAVNRPGDGVGGCFTVGSPLPVPVTGPGSALELTGVGGGGGSLGTPLPLLPLLAAIGGMRTGTPSGTF